MRMALIVVLVTLLFVPIVFCAQYRADVTTAAGVTKSAQVDIVKGEVNSITWDDGSTVQVTGAGLNESSAQGYDADGNLFDIRVADYDETPTE